MLGAGRVVVLVEVELAVVVVLLSGFLPPPATVVDVEVPAWLPAPDLSPVRRLMLLACTLLLAWALALVCARALAWSLTLVFADLAFLALPLTLAW